jgi:glycosyltransferase involved in cell wall biosynthesis
MKDNYPSKILISGGKPAGGVTSFAEALRCGFTELGLAVEIDPAAGVLRRPGELRDPGILKILSLAAVFGAPLTRRAICMAHGFPCAAYLGWPMAAAILASLRLANACRGTQLVAVSDYSSLTLRTIFGLRVDAVVRNPMMPLFLETAPDVKTAREAITYVGRLHRSKGVDRLLPAISDVLDQTPGLVAWIVGDGPMRATLESMAAGDLRIKFLGALPPTEVRDRLRRSRVLVSASPTEPFGIVYLEGLSQGCSVVMPASGGGLEIAPELIGGTIQVFPVSAKREEVAAALHRAIEATPESIQLQDYSARAVAEAYLAIDARFDKRGILHAEAGHGLTSQQSPVGVRS